MDVCSIHYKYVNMLKMVKKIFGLVLIKIITVLLFKCI